MPSIDLHSHSTASDGLLTPSALVARAVAQGVAVLALTDHDDTGGLAEAMAAATGTPLTLVAGAELSATYETHTIHVVGLHIDPTNEALQQGLRTIREGRDRRAHRIAAALAEAGIPDAYAGARKYVTSERLISRSHFARYLVEQGRAKNTREVFKRYLTAGKPGYVAHAWASVPQAVGWIHAAGGQAVLAHPGRYAVTATGMRGLLAEFRDAGGDAIEVVSPSHTAAQYEEYAGYARVFGLLASAGSDYHGPGEGALDLGGLPPLPAGATAVWSAW
ncbi:MAG: PHP domain-containing protein [Burkholderiales bacterium]|nr:PHP domain-containing protein [Burkholderiales bacterium]